MKLGNWNAFRPHPFMDPGDHLVLQKKSVYPGRAHPPVEQQTAEAILRILVPSLESSTSINGCPETPQKQQILTSGFALIFICQTEQEPLNYYLAHLQGSDMASL